MGLELSLILHLRCVGRGVKTLLIVLLGASAKKVSLSPPFFPSLQRLLFRSEAPTEGAPRCRGASPEHSLHRWPKLFGTTANFYQLLRDLIGFHTGACNTFPVLRGLKRILCSMENIQLLGQTYCSDGAPLQPRRVQKAV